MSKALYFASFSAYWGGSELEQRSGVVSREIYLSIHTKHRGVIMSKKLLVVLLLAAVGSSVHAMPEEPVGLDGQEVTLDGQEVIGPCEQFIL